MNDRQIEAAARKFCELRGMNPDENAMESINSPEIPRWRLSIHHVKNHMAMQEAVEYAKNGWNDRDQDWSPVK